MSPLISIVGKSKSGKTFLIQKLIAELKSRGYRVATVKHVPQDISFDEPEKDSWHHIQAGSDATVISSPNRLVLIKPVGAEPALDEVARLLGGDYDIILTEGFKNGDAPKIETHRREAGAPLGELRGLVAMVTDEPAGAKVKQFSFDEVKGLADFLEESFIKREGELLSLYVNGSPISLSPFPEEIIRNILMGMAASLRGVGKIKSLDIFLRRKA